jgi:hypothetical protein
LETSEAKAGVIPERRDSIIGARCGAVADANQLASAAAVAIGKIKGPVYDGFCVRLLMGPLNERQNIAKLFIPLDVREELRLSFGAERLHFRGVEDPPAPQHAIPSKKRMTALG